MANTLFMFVWPTIATNDRLFSLAMVVAFPFYGIAWVLQKLDRTAKRALRLLQQFIEFIALLPFRKIRRALSSKDASLLIELSVGAMTTSFGLWMHFGYGSPLIRMTLGHSWPKWAWAAIVIFGLAALVCTGKSRYVRCQALGFTLTLWGLFLIWLNARAGLTLIHYLVGPVFIFGVIAVLLLLKTPFDEPYIDDSSDFFPG